MSALRFAAGITVLVLVGVGYALAQAAVKGARRLRGDPAPW